MGKRRLFLLFLSAMTVSIIIMVIIYGVFIKDFDFTFNVKNPEMAPSPIDVYNQDEEDEELVMEEDEDKNPAKVSTPDQAGTEAETAQETADTSDEMIPQEEEEIITEVVPLEPQINPKNAPVPANNTADDSSQPGDGTPTLHFVYLDGFTSRASAEQAIQQLQERNLSAHPYIRQHNGRIILQFGVFSDRENAESMAQQLRNQNVFVKVD